MSALRWYVDRFAERSKIKVELAVPDDFSRLLREVETAVFRVVQECLTNIHRHSESSSAKIRITRSAELVHVEIEDRGRGISPETLIELRRVAPPVLAFEKRERESGSWAGA